MEPFMADETIEVVVLEDKNGNYYVLPRETLEQARVPEEDRAELERSMSDDTQGFFTLIERPVGGEFLFRGGFVARGPLTGLLLPAVQKVGEAPLAPGQVAFGDGSVH